MNREEKIIRDVLKRGLKTAEQEKCPGEIELARYMEGSLEDKASLEEHLFMCGDCLDLLIACEETRSLNGDRPLPDLSCQWIENAIALPASHSDRFDFFDAVLKITGGVMTVLRKANDLSTVQMPLPEPLRSGTASQKTESVTLRKDFPGIVAEVEVARSGRDRVNIQMTLKSAEYGTSNGGMRVNLYNPRNEIASYVVEDGAVSFMGLRVGEYVIKIIKNRTPAGKFSLKIKE